MNSPVFQLISIRFKEFIREPGIVFWSVIFPIAMAWVLGVAFTKRDEITTPVALIAEEGIVNGQLRGFLQQDEVIPGKGEEDITGYFFRMEVPDFGKLGYRLIPVSREEAMLMVKRGKTSLVIEAMADSILYHFDPDNSDARLHYLILTRFLAETGQLPPANDIRPLTIQGTRYIDYLLPGLLALGIMNSLLWGTSYALIEMRSKKLMRRMVATPMKKSHFIFSHFVARTALSFFETLILWIFAWAYFSITIQGSITALMLMFLAGNILFTGVAVLISMRTSSSRIGAGLINAVTLPMMILSGIFFSYHNFPEAMVSVIQYMPLTILADSIRLIFTEGAAVADILSGFIALSLTGLLMMYVGLRYFKWY